MDVNTISILLKQIVPDAKDAQIEQLAEVLFSAVTGGIADATLSDAGCVLHGELTKNQLTRGEKLITRICLNAFRNDDVMPIKTQRTLNDAKSVIEKLED